jgi:D-sedoheptulose 7-phosphate isomerase
VDFDEILAQATSEHHRLVDAFLERHGRDLETLARWCVDSLSAGGKILFFGNGGSASESAHLAAEFVNRFDRNRPALAAIALASDGPVLTSIANDSNFREVFARQIEALGRKGDVAIGISASGRSPNVLAGLRAARGRGMRAALLLGEDGSEASPFADLLLSVPGKDVARIQEVHLLAGHLLCRRVEDLLAEPRT